MPIDLCPRGIYRPWKKTALAQEDTQMGRNSRMVRASLKEEREFQVKAQQTDSRSPWGRTCLRETQEEHGRFRRMWEGLLKKTLGLGRQ